MGKMGDREDFRVSIFQVLGWTLLKVDYKKRRRNFVLGWLSHAVEKEISVI
jgi:hypothetical protein